MADAHRPDRPLAALSLAIVAAVVAIDQATKAIAEASLPIGVPVDVLPILALFRVHNPGIAFSFLADFSGIGLTLATLAITMVVLVVWWRSTEGGRAAAVGYAFIVGGAIGNLIDRVRFGHVVDFLLLHFGDWTLFVFNLADTALTFGPLVLLFVYAWPKGASDSGSARPPN